MSPAWDRIAELFEAAVDMSAADRAAFLDRECGDDAALRAEVESLLAHEGSSEDLIAPAVTKALAGMTPPPSLGKGDRLGRFEIVREVGRGGMGTVYEAVRADDQYRQRVAVKVVKRGMDTDFVIARFRQERQILAALRHPNIAQLIDGGSTPDGRPYLVMEFVEGLTLTEYCDQNLLGLQERLRLFLKICGAVKAAHAALVVHRDLKPSNILVDTEGEPKLLDFGVAKLLDPALADDASIRTLTTMRILTPAFASPEQVRGDAVTTSSDIYALGALLYLLLTGRHAHRFGEQTTGGWERWILEQEPERPSEAAADDTRTRALRGDLDNIVLKALRKEPERRYSTVLEFASDIENYLSDRPVSARPDTVFYRTAKFVRRNRLAVAAFGAAVLGLTIGAIVAVHQARIARANAERANRRFDQVRSLARTLMFDVHDKIALLPGSTEAREAIVRTSVDYLDNLSREAGADLSLMSELSQAYARVASIQGSRFRANLGKDAEGRENLAKAIRLSEAVVALRPGDSAELARLANLYVQLAEARAKVGQDERPVTAKAIAAAAKLGPFAESKPEFYRTISYVNRHAHGQAVDRGDWALSEPYAQAALTAARQAVRGSGGQEEASLRDLQMSLTAAGRVYHRQGLVDKAIPFYRESDETCARILEKNPLRAAARRSRALNLLQYSRVLSSPFHSGGPDWKASHAMVLDALEIVKESERTDTGNVLRFFDRWIFEGSAAKTAARVNPAEAFDHVKAATAARAEYVKLSPNHAGIQELEVVLEHAAVAHYTARRYRESAAAFDACLAGMAPKHRALDTADVAAWRGMARFRAGDRKGAEADVRAIAPVLAKADFRKERADFIGLYAIAEKRIEWIAGQLQMGNGVRESKARFEKMMVELRSRGVSTAYLEQWTPEP